MKSERSLKQRQKPLCTSECDYGVRWVQMAQWSGDQWRADEEAEWMLVEIVAEETWQNHLHLTVCNLPSEYGPLKKNIVIAR